MPRTQKKIVIYALLGVALLRTAFFTFYLIRHANGWTNIDEIVRNRAARTALIGKTRQDIIQQLGTPNEIISNFDWRYKWTPTLNLNPMQMTEYLEIVFGMDGRVMEKKVWD